MADMGLGNIRSMSFIEASFRGVAPLRLELKVICEDSDA
jgi:hypothetical protein